MGLSLILCRQTKCNAVLRNSPSSSDQSPSFSSEIYGTGDPSPLSTARRKQSSPLNNKCNRFFFFFFCYSNLLLGNHFPPQPIYKADSSRDLGNMDVNLLFTNDPQGSLCCVRSSIRLVERPTSSSFAYRELHPVSGFLLLCNFMLVKDEVTPVQYIGKGAKSLCFVAFALR